MKEEVKSFFSINYSELEINMIIITAGFMKPFNLINSKRLYLQWRFCSSDFSQVIYMVSLPAVKTLLPRLLHPAVFDLCISHLTVDSVLIPIPIAFSIRFIPLQSALMFQSQ